VAPLPERVAGPFCVLSTALYSPQGFELRFDIPENSHNALCKGKLLFQIRRTPLNQGNVPCPRIFIRLCGTRRVHDGYGRRQAKVRPLTCQFAQAPSGCCSSQVVPESLPLLSNTPL
jgi:hypothetical protein